MTEPSFTEKLAQLQADAKRRQELRDAGELPGPTWRDRGVGLLWILALVALVLVGLGLVALVLWIVVESIGAIVWFLGAVLVVVVASAAWQQMRG